MTIRLTLLLGLLIAVLFFALGRYTITSKTITQDKKTDEIKDTNTQKHEVITQVKKPDGSMTTITVIDTNRSTQDNKQSDTLTKTVEKPRQPITNISLIAGTTTHSFTSPPSYGISINREIAGPITVGAFGLVNGTIGISIGVNF
jgi:lipopolysaccharide export LptBFGC system permease protein LptF